MASILQNLLPTSCWRSIARSSRRCDIATRSLSTYHRSVPASQLPPSMLLPQIPQVHKKIKTYPPPSSPAAQFKDPISHITAAQIAVLDPHGQRTQLFSRTNRESAKVGDILLVRQRNGDPFAGVCINIRRRGVDSAILLRNELTRVGVEMWYKIYSPNVEGIEVVQRREKRARRARLTYMRKPKHDARSVQGVVLQYQRQQAVLRSGVKDDRRVVRKKGKGKK